MIRPVATPLDLLLVRSAQDKGIALEPLETLGAKALNRALVDLVIFPVGEAARVTYVMHEVLDGETLQGFVQMQRDLERDGVQVTFVAPAPEQSERALLAWERLFDYAGLRLGSLGVRRIFVDAPQGTEEHFRRTGFTLYAQEDAFVLEGNPPDGLPSAEGWEPLGEQNRWELQRLYSITTPGPVQQAESPEGPAQNGGFFSRLLGRREDWLFRSKGQVIALVRAVNKGSVTRLRLLVHPDYASRSEELAGSALALMHERYPPPYVVRVRTYQGHLERALSAWGLVPRGRVSLMVRRTLAPEKAAEPVRLVGNFSAKTLPGNLCSRFRKPAKRPMH